MHEQVTEARRIVDAQKIYQQKFKNWMYVECVKLCGEAHRLHKQYDCQPNQKHRDAWLKTQGAFEHMKLKLKYEGGMEYKPPKYGIV